MKKPTSVTPVQRIAWKLAEISWATGLSISFLRKEAYKGKLTVKRFGQRVLVLDEDLRRYLTDRK